MLAGIESAVQGVQLCVHPVESLEQGVELAIAEFVLFHRVNCKGSAVPAAKGRYFFGDNCVSQIHSTLAGGSAAYRNEPFTVDGLSAFGEDARGELYLASVQSGNVYRLAP